MYNALTYELRPAHVEQTQLLLRERGRVSREGYVVWVGERTDHGIVRDVWRVAAEGDGAHAAVSFDDVLALGERVHRAGWRVLAQAHSHPGDAFHSSIDDRHPVSHQVGFISIVVPNFAFGVAGEGWAYHEHLGRGRWRRLTDEEVRKRFIVSGGKEMWWKRLHSVITGRLFSSAR